MPDSTKDKFDIDLWHGPVEDQKRSGRCWIYASCNFLRQKLCSRLGIQGQRVRLSTNYIYYYDQLRKAETFWRQLCQLQEASLDDPMLSALLREPVSSVGQWCYFASIAAQHGIVPQEAMPDTADTADGRRLTERLNQRLRQAARDLRSSDLPAAGADDSQEPLCQRRKSDISVSDAGDSQEPLSQRRKSDISVSEAGENKRISPAEAQERIHAALFSDLRSILSAALGKPPETFDWSYTDEAGRRHEYEEITPQFFLHQLCGVWLDRYVMLIHHPVREWTAGRLYTEEDKITGLDPFLFTLNVPMPVIKEAAYRQLRCGEQVVIGADIRKDADPAAGILEGKPAVFSKEEAIRYRDIKACHVMSVDGVQADAQGKPLLWRVQDSHGLRTGGDGHYVMDTAWFDAYVLNAAVRKEFLPRQLQNACASSPVYMPKSERF